MLALRSAVVSGALMIVDPVPLVSPISRTPAVMFWSSPGVRLSDPNVFVSSILICRACVLGASRTVPVPALIVPPTVKSMLSA
ncbi:MAG: hypothetical protein A3I63_06105 [Betaproteobacteria bacterium RIFCSPLOWO2_02_FULL_66_14]|nr:MAG: hypothetical protein A3I63_06105 [Betaproteobacteria bacterium RIFCSPLOWO2_02_FULL_66_14]